MRRRTTEDRRATPRGAAWAVLLLLVAGAPSMAGASDALPERGGAVTSPAERLASGFESLWHSLVDAWFGMVGSATAEAGTETESSPVPDPCDEVCSGRNVDLDPDG